MRPVLFLDKERASGFNGIMGFGSDKENPGKIIFSGDAALKLMNAFGAAEEADLKWIGIQDDQQLTIQYRQPFLPLLPFGIMYRFELLKRSNQYYTLNQRGGLTIKASPEAWFTAFVGRDMSKVLDRSIFLQALTLPPRTDFSNTFFGIEYQFRRLDMIRNPGSGIDFCGELTGGQKRLTEAADIPKDLIEAAGKLRRQAIGVIHSRFFLPLFHPRWIINTSISVAYRYAHTHLENEMMLLGGINSLRGFDEKSIPASAYALGTLELRYRFEASSHFKLFIDGGWYERKTSETYLRDIPFGFGAGLSIPSAAGLLEISYAFGIQQGNDFDFRTGRVHLGLIALF